jgi:hypothetical protein
MRNPTSWSPSAATLVRAFAGVSLLGLLLSIAAVAVVAVGAESVQTWGWYFRMEQAMALATPLALGFAGSSLAAGFALVWVASEGEREADR